MTPVAAAPAVALDYGDLGQAKYDQWAADTRKASELSGDERKEKAAYVALSRKNAAALESGISAAPAAATAPAESGNDDYVSLGREKYEFWLADARRASELSGEERKEKAESVAIRRRRGE